MTNKSSMVVAFATVIALSLIATTAFVTAESGDDTSATEKKKPSAPRYSEICAHGHNGFACDAPQYKKDIKDLQERVSVLEKLASKP